MKSHRKTTEQFIFEAKEVHGDKYDYSLVEYKRNSIKVKIICRKHGVFEQIPKAHLRPQHCPKCHGRNKSSEDVISEFKSVHGNKYDYSNLVYKNTVDKMAIICKKHGVFNQSYNNHIKGHGCNKCALDKARERYSLTKKEFISRSIGRHGNKYDYSKVEFINTHTNVTIICPQHGEFYQRPSKHMVFNGCKGCAKKIGYKYQRTTPTGWTVTNWQRSGDNSNRFDSFKVYVVRLFNKNESFYKIGRTYLKTHNRVVQIPYDYEIVKEIVFDNARGAFNKESELKRLHKEFKYIPEIKFAGMQECFKSILIESL